MKGGSLQFSDASLDHDIAGYSVADGGLFGTGFRPEWTFHVYSGGADIRIEYHRDTGDDHKHHRTFCDYGDRRGHNDR